MIGDVDVDAEVLLFLILFTTMATLGLIFMVMLLTKQMIESTNEDMIDQRGSLIDGIETSGKSGESCWR